MKENNTFPKIEPLFHANGADIIAAYENHVPDPKFANAIEVAREFTNQPEKIQDPWVDV